MKTAAMLFCFSLLFLSCQELIAPTESVNAKVGLSQLVISNSTSKEVFYAVFEQNTLSFIDWIAMCRENNLIEPHSSKLIEITDSTFLPSNKAVIYWWHKGKKLDGSGVYGADELRVITVSIK